MESGDSMRGWTMGMNVPVVLMVGDRGWTRHGVNIDTAATYTERYATTGGQPVPHAKTLAYHDVARACGYPPASRLTTAWTPSPSTPSAFYPSPGRCLLR